MAETPIPAEEATLSTGPAPSVDADDSEKGDKAVAGENTQQQTTRQPMWVLESRVYRGLNPYGYRPVVLIKIDLGQLEQCPTDKLDGFIERPLELIPTLNSHGCSYGEPGSFVRRMHEGTWLAHKEKDEDLNGREGGKTRTLVIIGGHEEKSTKGAILKEVARRTRGGRMVVSTVASHEPEGYFEGYDRVFHDLGLEEVVELEIMDRCEASMDEKLKLLDGAGGFFFTGGDQLKITSQIGDSPSPDASRPSMKPGA